MIKRILVCLGGTPYTPVAIERAIKLAKRFEAEITGVSVIDVSRLSNLRAVGGKRTSDDLDHRIYLTKERIMEAIGSLRQTAPLKALNIGSDRKTAKIPST